MKITKIKPATAISQTGAEMNPAVREAAINALRAQTDAVTELLAAYAQVGRAAAGLLRNAAGPPRAATPPPVSMHLKRFATQLANKVLATAELLTDEERARLGVLVPRFTEAAIANEPDVVEMVTRWIDLEPYEIAAMLTTDLDDLERRFAA